MISGTQQAPCNNRLTSLSPWNGISGVGRLHKSRKAAEQRGCAVIVSESRGQSYHVEVEVSDDEDPEGMYKRFRNSCNLSGMVYEARRRKFFENPQDIKKRKQQEKGLRKMRDIRERFLQTYDDAHADTPPFSELFAGDEDIYDVLGDGSYDEEVPNQHAAARGSDTRRRQNTASSGPPKGSNVVMRSVPSDGPKAATQGAKARSNGKPKSQVQTARTRKAARQQTRTKK